MPVNYAEAYQQAIEQAFYNDSLYSSDLWNSPSNSLITFEGAKHFRVPTLTIEHGRQDRARRTITTPVANYSNDWLDYTMTQERYWSTLVDPSDVDESNQVLSIANITNQFNIEQKMPEMDRYMFSKLYKDKVKIDGAKSVNTDTLDAKTILNYFDTMMADMNNARVPMQNRVLYVTPKVNAMLKQADAINRTIVLSNSRNIDRSVYSLDSVTIVEVPDDLMMTDFDFSDGSKTKAGAGQINMMLISNGVQVAPQKYSFVGFDEPSAANSGNYLYYENAYYDVMLLNNKSKGIAFNVTAGTTAAATSASGTGK